LEQDASSWAQALKRRDYVKALNVATESGASDSAELASLLTRTLVYQAEWPLTIESARYGPFDAAFRVCCRQLKSEALHEHMGMDLLCGLWLRWVVRSVAQGGNLQDAQAVLDWLDTLSWGDKESTELVRLAISDLVDVGLSGRRTLGLEGVRNELQERGWTFLDSQDLSSERLADSIASSKVRVSQFSGRSSGVTNLAVPRPIVVTGTRARLKRGEHLVIPLQCELWLLEGLNVIANKDAQVTIWGQVRVLGDRGVIKGGDWGGIFCMSAYGMIADFDIEGASSGITCRGDRYNRLSLYSVNLNDCGLSGDGRLWVESSRLDGDGIRLGAADLVLVRSEVLSKGLALEISHYANTLAFDSDIRGDGPVLRQEGVGGPSHRLAMFRCSILRLKGRAPALAYADPRAVKLSGNYWGGTYNEKRLFEFIETPGAPALAAEFAGDVAPLSDPPR
jgi:hypothetical protein